MKRAAIKWNQDSFRDGSFLIWRFGHQYAQAFLLVQGDHSSLNAVGIGSTWLRHKSRVHSSSGITNSAPGKGQLPTHSLRSLQVLPVQLVDTGGTNTLTSPGSKQFSLSLSACQEQPNLLKKL